MIIYLEKIELLKEFKNFKIKYLAFEQIATF